MARLSPLALAPIGIIAGIAALATVTMFRDASDGLPPTMVGGAAPALGEDTLGDFAGVTPGILAGGEVTLVNFWASWCPPCRAEHPRLLALAGDGLPIVGVNYRDSEDAAIEYLTEAGNPFVAIAFDPEGDTAMEWGTIGLPETFIIGGDGTVLFRYVGPLVGSDYEQRFVPALAEALSN